MLSSNDQVRQSLVQQSQSADTQQQQVQPKIPVICGFHKRVLLLTSQVGMTSS